jgi:hypothetical protein
MPGIEGARMNRTVEADLAHSPLNVGILSTETEVTGADDIAHVIQ